MNRGISLVLSLILAWPTSLSAAVSLSSQAGRSAPIPALGFQPGSTNALLPVGDLTLQTALPGASGLSAPEAVLPAALETVAPAAAAEPTAAAPQLAALAATPSAALAAPQAASERVVAPRTTALAVKDEQAAAKPTVLQGTEQLSKAVAAAPTSALNAAFDNAAGLGDASPAPGTAVAEPGGPGHNNLSGGGDGGEPKRPEPPAPAPRSSILRSLRVGFIAATALMAAKLAMLGAGAGLLSQAVYALGVDGHYTPGMAEEAAQSIVAQPLVEELTFRVAFVGAALYAARGKKGAAAAFWPIAVVSSFLFAAMHANSAFGADMFLAHALAGMTFAWVFRKEGLAAAWAAHGFGNLLVAIAGVAFIGYASLSAAGSSFALAPLVLPAAAVLGLAYLAWRGLRAQKADVAAGKLQAYRLGPIGAALFASVIGAYLLTPAGMATTLWYMAAAAALISYGLYKSVSAASRKGALAAGLATALLIFGAENKPYHWWKYGGEPLTRAPVAYVVGDEQLLAGPFADPAIADEAAPILRQWRKNGFFYFQDIRRAVEILSKSNDARATKILEFIFERGEGVLGEMRWLDETLTTELAKRGSPVIRSTVRDYERLERSLFTMDRARMAMHAAGRYGSDKTFAEATATLRRLEPGRTRNEAANALGRGLAEAPREDALRRLAAASEAAPQDALTQTDAAFLLSARLAMKDLDGVGDPRVGEIYRRA
ncbi:MAG TPA: CPBP family intramembrane glutamic endopeptidase, partial [Elusimicrobiota bacterium]|nr:CPBP family intramembrane glutamic endopeptidase [Elusimicrobiota bacterium]